ncbi:Mu-like prophage I protein [Ensifer adhaerens]|nr:Mu-like prophage I protein [Ensifer adhaerens]
MRKNINSLIIALHAAENGGVPEWLNLLPATSFEGVDGRGPYAAPNIPALIALFQREGVKLPIDENHAIDLAGKAGMPSPARGWIVDMQARADGLWGRVEWTAAGEAMVAGKDYGYISPVFTHSESSPYVIGKILRVALTNDPNLKFLKSLHSNQETEMLEELRKALGLPETATEADVLNAVKSAHQANAANVALMARVREAAGVPATADETVLVTALQSRGKATAAEAEVAELKGQVVSLQTTLSQFTKNAAAEKATAFIEGALKEGKIVPAQRDSMIAWHQRDPQAAEDFIKNQPALNAGGLGGKKPAGEGENVRSTEDDAVLAQMGLDPTAFETQKKALHSKGLI